MPATDFGRASDAYLTALRDLAEHVDQCPDCTRSPARCSIGRFLMRELRRHNDDLFREWRDCRCRSEPA